MCAHPFFAIMSTTPAAEAAVELAQAWDGVEAIRKSVRDHGRLLLVAGPDGNPLATKREEVVPKCGATARLNKHVLIPVMNLMGRVEDYKLPTIDVMLGAVNTFYQDMKVELNASAIYQEAWGVRKLAQLVAREGPALQENAAQGPCTAREECYIATVAHVDRPIIFITLSGIARIALPRI